MHTIITAMADEAVRTYTYPGEETLGAAVFLGLAALAVAVIVIISNRGPFRLAPTAISTALTVVAAWFARRYYSRETWTLTWTHVIVESRDGERRYLLSDIVGLKEYRRFAKDSDAPMYELCLANRKVLKLLGSDANDFIQAVSKLSGVPVGQATAHRTP